MPGRWRGVYYPWGRSTGLSRCMGIRGSRRAGAPPRPRRHLRDHREHDVERAPSRGAHERAKLLAQDRRPVEQDAQGAPTQCRILFAIGAEVGQQLVAADVQRAEHHGPIARLVVDALVQLGLRPDVGIGRPRHERNLGAVESDAVGPGLVEMREVDQEAGVEHERDAGAVAGLGRQVALTVIGRAPLLPGREAILEGRQHVLSRPQEDLRVVAIDDHGVARLDALEQVPDLPDQRDVERAGDDRHMGGR